LKTETAVFDEAVSDVRFLGTYKQSSSNIGTEILGGHLAGLRLSMKWFELKAQPFAKILNCTPIIFFLLATSLIR
jgi:hypothetical protein